MSLRFSVSSDHKLLCKSESLRCPVPALQVCPNDPDIPLKSNPYAVTVEAYWLWSRTRDQRVLAQYPPLGGAAVAQWSRYQIMADMS
ncbi:hypothetical protein TNCV_4613761 [Trichonephila clavipes]|nr:hypothetical protein TNCV_4613761 [Trichonephila clavipes]